MLCLLLQRTLLGTSQSLISNILTPSGAVLYGSFPETDMWVNVRKMIIRYRIHVVSITHYSTAISWRNFMKYYLCSGFGKWGSPISTPAFDFSLSWMGATLVMGLFCCSSPSETETSLLELSESSGVTSATELPILELLLLLWSESTQTHSTFQHSTPNKRKKQSCSTSQNHQPPIYIYTV